MSDLDSKPEKSAAVFNESGGTASSAALSSYTYNYFSSCSFCRATTFKRKGKNGTGERLHGQVVQCAQCGLLFVNPIADDPSRQRYYENYGDLHPPTDQMLEKAQRNAAQWSSKVSPVDRRCFLDIGAGAGVMMLAFQKAGWEVYGVELSRTAIEYARTRLGLYTIQESSADNAQYPEKSFDLINFWHVIEHVRDPFSLLQRIARWLKPGGILHLGTPFPESLDVKLRSWVSGYYGLGDDHTYAFPKHTLKHMVLKAGLVITDHQVYATKKGGSGPKALVHNLLRSIRPQFVAHFQSLDAFRPLNP